jgi:hypothetical protein
MFLEVFFKDFTEQEDQRMLAFPKEAYRIANDERWTSISWPNMKKVSYFAIFSTRICLYELCYLEL